MIGHFPAPLPDELLYSVCARYSERVKYRNKEAVMAELFGRRGAAASIDLPSHLAFLQCFARLFASSTPRPHLVVGQPKFLWFPCVAFHTHTPDVKRKQAVS